MGRNEKKPCFPHRVHVREWYGSVRETGILVPGYPDPSYAKDSSGHAFRKDRFSVGESWAGPLLHLRERPFSGKNDTIVLRYGHFTFRTAGIGIILPRKNPEAKGVPWRFLSKTATGGSKVKETPVLAIGFTSEGVILRRRKGGFFEVSWVLACNGEAGAGAEDLGMITDFLKNIFL